jgi:transglutaminase-like putative cysteine protease
MAACRSRAALALLVALASPPVRGAETLSLQVLPVRTSAAVDDAAAPLRLALRVLRPERLAAQHSGATVADDGALRLVLRGSPTLPGAADARHLRASFVVDWDEPAVAALHDRLSARAGTQPSLDALREAADSAIPKKSFDRGWEVASVVAAAGAGDCTEHAVLLAALARSFGLPARVVIGALLAVQPGAVRGYGHAWTEIHDGAGWRIVDATPVAGLGAARYLPLVALEEEGPGYALAVTVALQAMLPREIEVLGTE